MPVKSMRPICRAIAALAIYLVPNMVMAKPVRPDYSILKDAGDLSDRGVKTSPDRNVNGRTGARTQGGKEALYVTCAYARELKFGGKFIHAILGEKGMHYQVSIYNKKTGKLIASYGKTTTSIIPWYAKGAMTMVTGPIGALEGVTHGQGVIMLEKPSTQEGYNPIPKWCVESDSISIPSIKGYIATQKDCREYSNRIKEDLLANHGGREISTPKFAYLEVPLRNEPTPEEPLSPLDDSQQTNLNDNPVKANAGKESHDDLQQKSVAVSNEESKNDAPQITIDTSKLEKLLKKKIAFLESLLARGEPATNAQLERDNAVSQEYRTELEKVMKEIETHKISNEEKTKLFEEIGRKLQPDSDRLIQLMKQAVGEKLIAGVTFQSVNGITGTESESASDNGGCKCKNPSPHYIKVSDAIPAAVSCTKCGKTVGVLHHGKIIRTSRP